MNLIELHNKIEAVCPIFGINTNKVIAFKDEATSDQRAAAQAIANANDFNALSSDELKAVAEASIQNLLDSTAKEHGYDNILSLCSYATSTNLTWQKEGQYGCNYRDACWTKAEQIQTDATAGNWPITGAGQMPTVNDVLSAMPAVVWPV